MEVEINGVAVLAAAAINMIVGAIWYSPYVFGKQWMKLTGVTPQSMKESGNKGMLAALVRSLLTAFVLAHLIFLSHSFFQNSYLQDSLMTGFWVYFGFIASTLLMHDTFEGRRKKLSLINASNEFVTIMVMAVVVGLFG